MGQLTGLMSVGVTVKIFSNGIRKKNLYICQKLHKIERNWTERERASLSPLDPPLVLVSMNKCWAV